MKSTDNSAIDIRSLDVFIGEWKTEGEMFNEAGDETIHFEAMDVYEWFAGEHFLVHNVDGMMDGHEIKALEIFGVDDNNENLVSRSIDNSGQSSEYRVVLEGTAWSIDGNTERFRGRFNESFSRLDGQWDTLEEGAGWQKWMTIKLTKVS